MYVSAASKHTVVINSTVNDKMASKKVFDLMEAKEDRKEVTELLTNTAWTLQDLDEKHGVRSGVELSCG